MRNRWLTIFMTICLFLLVGCNDPTLGTEIYQGKNGIESVTLYAKLLELAGKRPDEILFSGEFSEQKELRISGESNFAGMELFDFDSLESLTLVRCNLSDGKLPEFIVGLTSLKSLTIEGCGLMEIPEEIAACKGIRELYLRDNQLSSLPKALQSMEKLNLLDLGKNLFTDIPVELQNMNQLVHLDLSENDIVTLDGITGPNRLDTLNLSYNRITQLSESLLMLDKLQVLLLAGNRLTELPEFLNGFAYLNYLDVSDNPSLSFDAEKFPTITIEF